MTTASEKARARMQAKPRPVFRFGTQQYKCPFCGLFAAYAEHHVLKHMETCPQRKGK